MLSLIVNDQIVDLSSDISISMNLKSPIFNELGSYSYPFHLPFTDRNKKILKFHHRIEGVNSPYEVFRGILLWKGITIFQGSLKCQISNTKGFECTLYQGEGDFYYQLQNRSLRQIDMGEIVMTEAAALAYFNSCYGKCYPEVNIGFPEIPNEVYFDPVSDDPDQLMFNKHYTSNGPLHILTAQNNRTVLVPMVYLRWALKKIFDGIGYTLNDQLFTSNAVYNKLAVYNSLSCNSLLPDFSYPMTHLLLNLHMPKISLKEFFNGIETNWNCRFFVNNIEKKVKLIPLDTIIKSAQVKPFSKDILSKSIELEDQSLGFQLSMGLDGDDTIFDPWRSAEESLTKNIKGCVPDIASLPQFPIAEIDERRYVLNLSAYMKFTSNKTWLIDTQMWQNVFSKFYYLQEGQGIESKLSTLITPNNQTDYVSCGNKLATWKDITPRVFFLNAEYGKMRGRNELSGYSLLYNKPGNLFERYYKSYFDFKMNSKLVKVQKQMDMLELKDLDFSVKHEIHGDHYLVKECQVNLKKDYVSPATLSMYRIGFDVGPDLYSL